MPGAPLYAADLSVKHNLFVLAAPILRPTPLGEDQHYFKRQRAIEVWSLTPLKRRAVVPTGFAALEQQVAISPDGRRCVIVLQTYMAVCDVVGMRKIYDTLGFDDLKGPDAPWRWTRSYPNAVAFTDEANTFVTLTQGDWSLPHYYGVHSTESVKPIKMGPVTLIGRDPIHSNDRDMPIVGRLANGEYLQIGGGFRSFSLEDATLRYRDVDAPIPLGVATGVLLKESGTVMWGDAEGHVHVGVLKPEE